MDKKLLKFIENKALPLTKGWEQEKRNRLRNKIRYSKILEELAIIFFDFKINLIVSDLVEEFEAKDALNFDFKINDAKDLKLEVLENLSRHKTREATELVVEEILERNKIYTIRNDEKTEMWIYDKGIYIPQGKTFIKEHCRNIFGEAYTPHLGNEVIVKIAADTYVDETEFFGNIKIEEIAVKNGILNIFTKKIRPFDSDDFFFNKIPITFDPSKKCPSIKKHFKEVLKDEEDVPIIEELFGDLLLKEYKIEKAFMFCGSGRNGKGKCEVAGNKVLMANGNRKKVENIKIGDKIISPQKNGPSTIATVVYTHSRFEPNIYEVREYTRKKRLLYACADNHLIPFYKTHTKRIKHTQKRTRKRVLELRESQEIAKLSPTKSNLACFTTPPITFDNKEDAKIDGYCFGAWLGDGHFAKRIRYNKMKNPKRDRGKHGYSPSITLGITSADKEIIDIFNKKYPNELINQSNKPNNKSITYHLTTKGKFGNGLKKFGLLGKGSSKKFIPKGCLISSLNYRFSLLAGLIDTDGFVAKNGSIYYTTKSSKLAENIKELVFSLGGYAEIRNVKKHSQNGFYGIYKELSIQFKEKTKIHLQTWKKLRLKDTKHNPRMIGIEVIKRRCGGMVYGFELDKKDSPSQWYITENWMVTHNTLELMKRFLGVNNCSNVPLQQFESDIFSLGELFNKMANLSGDIDKRALIHTGAFKNLTGRDLISAPRKFLPRINFVNYAKMVFCSNELPITYDLTPAFWSRWVILDFPYVFVSQKEYDKTKDKTNYKIADPEIINKLTTNDELSGLLNLALEGLKRLLKQNDFSYSKSIEEIKNLWIKKSDSLLAFCMDRVEENWDSTTTKAKFRQTYSLYCKKNKIKMLGDKHIKHILTTNYAVSEEREVIGGKQIACWSGIHLKSNELDESGSKISKGSKEREGVCPYIQTNSLPIGVNTISKPTNLTKNNKEKSKPIPTQDETLEVFEEKVE